MRTANNNFTVKNLVDKYHNYVLEHCSYTEVYSDEVGVEKVPLTYGSEDLLVSIYSTITGQSADSRILDALSSYAKEYKEKYSNVLTEQEYAFLCENFVEVCDICFQYLENDQWHYMEESVYTSEEIELIREHLTPKPGSTIFVANSRLCINANLFPNCKFKGCTTMSDTVTDTDRYSWALAQIKLFSMGIESNILPCINECFEEEYVNDVDYVIWNNPHSGSFEEAKKMFQKLNPQAKMFILMDKQYAAGKKGEAYELRKLLVKSRAIESIVLFYEKQYDFYFPKICVVADKSGCNTVRLYNQVSRFSKEISETSLDYEILWPGYYMATRPKNGIPLSNLVKYENLSHLKERDNRITNFTTRNGHTLIDDAKTMPVVWGYDLARDYKDANMCTKELKPACDPLYSEWTGLLRSLKEPCVLLYEIYYSYVLGYIKDIPMSGICTFSFAKCLIPQNGMDVRYIAALLLSPEIKEQITTICDSYIYDIDRILEKIIVPNHTDKERLAFLSEANYEAMLASQETLRQEQKNYSKAIRMRKHALTQSMSSIEAMFYALNAFREHNGGCLTDDDVISRVQGTTARQAFEFLSQKINDIMPVLDHIADVEYSFSEPEWINPEQFIENYISKHENGWINFRPVITWEKGHNIATETLKDEKGEIIINKGDVLTSLYFSKDALEKVMNNIVSNAMSHGFTDQERKDYKLRFSWRSYGSSVIVNVENNGMPIPNDRDTASLLEYGVSTVLHKDGHNGIGCNEIDDIMRRYNGKVKIESNPESEFTVKYELIFEQTNIIKSYSI